MLVAIFQRKEKTNNACLIRTKYELWCAKNLWRLRKKYLDLNPFETQLKKHIYNGNNEKYSISETTDDLTASTVFPNYSISISKFNKQHNV